MTHEIYVFGSVCRGDPTPTSDIDVLVVPFDTSRVQYPRNWSVYSPAVLSEYFKSGRLFAWHLHLEARCVYSPHSAPFLPSLGPPAPYSTVNRDLDDLEALLCEALDSLDSGTVNIVFELGIVYTAIRDLAMSASWSLMGRPCFSTDAPFRLPLVPPLPREVYYQCMVARHASTRGARLCFDPKITVSSFSSSSVRTWVALLRGAV